MHGLRNLACWALIQSLTGYVTLINSPHLGANRWGRILFLGPQDCYDSQVNVCRALRSTLGPVLTYDYALSSK